MTDLPASIEAALQEAGFTGMEIVALKKLLQEDALTLRELAGKTGKSTGALDQAMKKLLKKGILSRETINGVPKYVLRSLDVVLKWMEEDTKMKQEMMMRRQQNFETFIRSIVIAQNNGRRPEMEYFEGREGMKKAYMQILNRGNDIAMYGPTLYLAEEDPLRELKVQWFRERQHRGIFCRVITDDTPLGRRFQSRDPFEYRKSILVDPEAYPFQFEKMIVGDTIACFQPDQDRAVFVRYPEYAESERVFFERLWNKKVQRAAEEQNAYASNQKNPPLDVITIPMKTKTLSSVREFFLSKRSVASLVCFCCLSAVLTYGLYLREVTLNTKRIQERALSIAATGALQFDADDLNQLQTADDIHKPEYAKVIYQLNLIRNQNAGMKYAYIMRPTDDPEILAFVADADSLDLSAKKDLNDDGLINEKDALSPPGERYDISTIPAMQKMFLGEATVDSVPHVDQWGKFISGYGPIKDDAGRVVALFGADIEANTVKNLSRNTIVFSSTFVVLLLIFILIRLLAFNRSLLRELEELLKEKRNLLAISLGAVATIFVSGGLYYYFFEQSIANMRQRIEAIATTGILQFNGDDLKQLDSVDDLNSPIYLETVRKLHDIRAGNSDIKYVYLLRPHQNDSVFEFIADADAYNINPFAKNDINHDGQSDGMDEVGYPSRPYDVSNIPILIGNQFSNPVSMSAPYTDQWGTVITGYAPIKNKDGIITALLSVDVDASSIGVFHSILLLPLGAYIAIVFICFLCWSPGVRMSLLYELSKKFCTRNNLTKIGLVLVCIYWIIFGLYWYTQHLLIQEKGKRLIAIAATAASQINPDDLDRIHFAKDMQTPEYQRIFKLLNDVRDKNSGVEYVYILRPTKTDGIWEFVVDADSNYYIPFIGWDYTGDGVINESDENSPPGVCFNMAYSFPKIYQRGLYEPVFEDSLVMNQWGAGYTGSVPIFKNGKPIAILGVDDEADYMKGKYN